MGCAIETSKPKRRRKGLSTARPYSELSEEAKERALNWWREHERHDFDADGMTELLLEVLDYEYGIDVSRTTRKYGSGKTYDRPDIEWSFSYCQGDGVSFKGEVDIEKLIAHGVPGCEYFSHHAEKLAQLWRIVQVLEALLPGDYPPEWDIGFDRSNNYARDHAYVKWDCHEQRTEDETRTLDGLRAAMQDVLDAIYDDACHRLEKIGYAEVEHQDSDEYIAEMLENNPHILFDEEGDMA